MSVFAGWDEFNGQTHTKKQNEQIYFRFDLKFHLKSRKLHETISIRSAFVFVFKEFTVLVN